MPSLLHIPNFFLFAPHLSLHTHHLSFSFFVLFPSIPCTHSSLFPSLLLCSHSSIITPHFSLLAPHYITDRLLCLHHSICFLSPPCPLPSQYKATRPVYPLCPHLSPSQSFTPNVSAPSTPSSNISQATTQNQHQGNTFVILLYFAIHVSTPLKANPSSMASPPCHLDQTSSWR